MNATERIDTMERGFASESERRRAVQEAAQRTLMEDIDRVEHGEKPLIYGALARIGARARAAKNCPMTPCCGCNGSGRITNFMWGRYTSETCSDCHGTGRETRDNPPPSE